MGEGGLFRHECWDYHLGHLLRRRWGRAERFDVRTCVEAQNFHSIKSYSRQRLDVVEAPVNVDKMQALRRETGVRNVILYV